MSMTTPIASAPYAHQRTSVRRTMGLVMLALTPATLHSIYLFGWPALNLFLVTVAAALLLEAASLRLAGKPVGTFATDGSAIVAAWLLTMGLPPWAPWWIGVVGAFCAIVLAKHVFGGIGQNIFNPAMVGRIALLISFPLEMTLFVHPMPIGSADAPGFMQGLAITFAGIENMDAVSSASTLGFVKTELGRGLALADIMPKTPDLISMMVGVMPGSAGETSSILLVAGGMFLIGMRIITWHIPVAMLGTLALLATGFHLIDPLHYPDAVFHLFSGAALLGAFFIATDLVTSPVTAPGKLVFGAGCGALTYIIRTWAGFPEGLGFAVLLMNALTPMIDHYIRPRIYGRTSKGAPLQYKNESAGGEK